MSSQKGNGEDELHALNQIPVDSSQVLSLTTSVNITLTSLNSDSKSPKTKQDSARTKQDTVNNSLAE